jgi:hypothetical protein
MHCFYSQLFVMQIDVLLLSPDIFRHILDHEYLTTQDFSLVIFDECQHAVGKSPMAIVCNLINETPVTINPSGDDIIPPKPRIFGMLSSPLVSKKGFLVAKIKSLEATLNSRIVACPKKTQTREEIENVNSSVTCNVLRYSKQSMCKKCKRSCKESDEITCSCAVSELKQTPSSIHKMLTTASNDSDSRSTVMLNLATSPTSVLHHAYLRVCHASYLFEVHTIIPKLSLSSVLSSARKLTTGIGGLESLLPPKRFCNSSFSILKLLEFMKCLLGVCEDCGVLCAICALEVWCSKSPDDDKFQHANGEEETISSEGRIGGVTSSQSASIIDDKHKLNQSRVEFLLNELLSGCFIHPINTESQTFNNSTLFASQPTISDIDVVMTSSLFDMFAALVVMLGSEYCSRWLVVIDCDHNLAQREGNQATWFFYLREIVKLMAAQDTSAVGCVLGSVGGALETLCRYRRDGHGHGHDELARDTCNIQGLMKEMSSLCGCLLKGMSQDNVVASLLANTSNSVCRNTEKAKSCGDLHINLSVLQTRSGDDKRKSSAMNGSDDGSDGIERSHKKGKISFQSPQHDSRTNVRLDQQNVNFTTADATHTSTEFMFPLLTSKVVVCFRALLCGHNSSGGAVDFLPVTTDCEKKRESSGQVSEETSDDASSSGCREERHQHKSLVFVRNSLAASSLRRLLSSSLPLPLLLSDIPSAQQHQKQAAPVTTDTTLSIPLCGNIVFFADDMAAAERIVAGDSCWDVLSYDPPASAAEFKLQTGTCCCDYYFE